MGVVMVTVITKRGAVGDGVGALLVVVTRIGAVEVAVLVVLTGRGAVEATGGGGVVNLMMVFGGQLESLPWNVTSARCSHLPSGSSKSRKAEDTVGETLNGIHRRTKGPQEVVRLVWADMPHCGQLKNTT